MASVGYRACVFALFAFIWSVSGEVPVPFEDCGTQAGQVLSIVMTPDVPRPGDIIVFKVQVKMSQTVRGGTMTVTMYRRFFRKNIQIFRDKTAISDMLPEGKKLPLKRGQNVELQYSIAALPFILKGSYFSEVRALDEKGKTLVCIDMTVQLRGSKFVGNENLKILPS